LQWVVGIAVGLLGERTDQLRERISGAALRILGARLAIGAKTITVEVIKHGELALTTCRTMRLVDVKLYVDLD